MMKDNISLDSILYTFESVLKIEYLEHSTEKVIASAVASLEEAYNVRMDKDLYTLQAENQALGDTLSILLMQITDCCKTMSFYTVLCTFNRSIGISLADVAYFGFAKDTLMNSLKYLEDKDLYTQRDIIVRPLTVAMTNVDMCSIKRCVIIMLVLEKLGVAEGVAVMAQYLYLGGLVT